MKSKSPRFLNASRLFYMHLTLFIGGVLLYWYAYVQEITYPGNAASPIDRWQQNGIDRINFSLMWALIILIHFAIVSGLNWRKNRQIEIAESYIKQSDTDTTFDDTGQRLQDNDIAQDEYHWMEEDTNTHQQRG